MLYPAAELKIADRTVAYPQLHTNESRHSVDLAPFRSTRALLSRKMGQRLFTGRDSVEYSRGVKENAEPQYFVISSLPEQTSSQGPPYQRRISNV